VALPSQGEGLLPGEKCAPRGVACHLLKALQTPSETRLAERGAWSPRAACRIFRRLSVGKGTLVRSVQDHPSRDPDRSGLRWACSVKGLSNPRRLIPMTRVSGRSSRRGRIVGTDRHRFSPLRRGEEELGAPFLNSRRSLQSVALLRSWPSGEGCSNGNIGGVSWSPTPCKPHGLLGQKGLGVSRMGSKRYPQLSCVQRSRVRIHESAGRESRFPSCGERSSMGGARLRDRCRVSNRS